MTTPMTQLKPESTERAVAGAAGLAWLLTVTLVATQADTDPVGASYDAANRSLTLALGLLAASGYLAWQRSRSRADAVRAIGLALALVGNLLEFWVLWASGGTTDATATRLGEDGALLSPVGFGVFAVGMLVQFGAGVARSRRRSLAKNARLASAFAGLTLLASTGLWAVGPAAAAVCAAIAAATWWLATQD